MGGVRAKGFSNKLQIVKRGALMALLAAACLSLTSCGSISSMLNSIIRLPGQICRAILP